MSEQHPLENSILRTVKPICNVEPDDHAFDGDLLVHTNTVLVILKDIGLPVPPGFFVSGEDQTWTDLLGDTHDYDEVKTLLPLRVRLIFDPPASSAVMEAMKETIKELEWRMYSDVEPEFNPTE